MGGLTGRSPTAATVQTHVLSGSAGRMFVHEHRPAATPLGIAIVAHGRNGAADQPQMLPIVDACLKRGLIVLAPDLCYSDANESAGVSRLFTMSAHADDIGIVLHWSSAGALAIAAPLILVGHSMGAYGVLRQAAGSARRAVSGLIAVSPVVSGNRLLAARQAMGAEALTILRKELPGAFEDWPQHDILPDIEAIKVPAGVIVGSDDTITPPKDADCLAKALPNCVWHDVVDGAHHCPVGERYAKSIESALDRLLQPIAHQDQIGSFDHSSIAAKAES